MSPMWWWVACLATSLWAWVQILTWTVSDQVSQMYFLPMSTIIKGCMVVTGGGKQVILMSHWLCVPDWWVLSLLKFKGQN